MVDDVLINKAATIERCVIRAKEEYEKSPTTFASDHTRQDAAILNVQRACEAALDMGQHLIRRERLGIPQSSRDVFTLLAQAGRKGNCWNNSPIESFWGRLKTACVHGQRFATREQARQAIMNWMAFYNYRRLYSSLGYLSPMQYEQRWYEAQRKKVA